MYRTAFQINIKSIVSVSHLYISSIHYLYILMQHVSVASISVSPLSAISIYDQYNLPIRIELLWSVNLFSNLDDDDDDRLSAVFVSKFS